MLSAATYIWPFGAIYMAMQVEKPCRERKSKPMVVNNLFTLTLHKVKELLTLKKQVFYKIRPRLLNNIEFKPAVVQAKKDADTQKEDIQA